MPTVPTVAKKENNNEFFSAVQKNSSLANIVAKFLRPIKVSFPYPFQRKKGSTRDCIIGYRMNAVMNRTAGSMKTQNIRYSP